MSMSIDRSQLRFTLIVLGLITAFGVGVWGPTYWQILSVKRQITHTEGELGITRGRTDGLAILAREVDDLRRQASGNVKIIPTHANLADVLRELSTQIEAEKLTSQGISTPETVSADDHTELPVQLTVKGSSKSIFALIGRVENLPRLVQFDEVEIQRDEKSPGHVQASLKLTTYYGTQEASRS